MKWVLTILVCVSGDCHTITQPYPAISKCMDAAIMMAAAAEAAPETISALQKISCEWKDEK